MTDIARCMQRLYDDWDINDRKSVYKLRSHAQPVQKYFGHMSMQELKSDTITAYVLHRREEGVVNGTINRELSILKRAYKLAYGAGEVDRLPMFPTLSENNVRQGTYTREDVDKLVAEMPAHYRPVVLYAYLTGRRRGEILQLKWNDVDLGRRIVTVRQGTTKNQEPDRIPLEGELLELLLDQWEAKESSARYRACPWVFHYRGQQIGDFNATFNRAAARAGLEGKLFHDLRRTFVTDAEEAGVPRSVAMRLTGHKTESMYQRYNIVRTETVRKGAEQLAAYRRAQDKDSK